MITIAFAAVDSQQQDNKERLHKDYIWKKKIRLEDMAKMFSMEDWEKLMIEEVKMRWGNRRKEIEEVEKKKIEEAKKRKEKKRKRAIRERRCFVCAIFGHMAHNCRNREEGERGSSMPQNRFEILRDRGMQRREGSRREVVKDRREILKEEKAKREKVQKKDQGKKKEKKVDDKKEKRKKEREVEIQGFFRGEILKGRYPLAWRKVRCYECGGLGHRKKDHREKKKKKIETEKKERDKIEEDKKKEIVKEKIEKDKIKKKKDKKIEIVKEEKKIEDKEEDKKIEEKKEERVQA